VHEVLILIREIEALRSPPLIVQSHNGPTGQVGTQVRFVRLPREAGFDCGQFLPDRIEIASRIGRELADDLLRLSDLLSYIASHEFEGLVNQGGVASMQSIRSFTALMVEHVFNSTA